MAGIRRNLSNPLSNQATPVLSQSELAEQGATEEEYDVIASNEEETPTEPIGVPISELPGADTPTGDDAIPGVQADETVQYTLSDLLAWIIGETTPADIGAVPDTRTVNGKALSSDIALTASDVGARPDNWTPSAGDVGAQPTITASGILKGDGSGGVSAAVAGTDYQAPLTAGTDYQTPLTFDNAPTENSNNPVTSGGIYSAMNTRYSETELYSTLTDVHTDTTITLSEAYSQYKFLMLLFNSRSPASAGYRMPLTVFNQELRQGGYYTLRNPEVDGYVRVNIVSGQSNQIRIQDTDIATLYLVSVTGLR